MPRKKKPQPEMPDRELYESLFPKKIRERVEKEVELEVPEKEADSEDEQPMERDGS